MTSHPGATPPGPSGRIALEPGIILEPNPVPNNAIHVCRRTRGREPGQTCPPKDVASTARGLS
eukprot:9481836-Pyramimonas_sp.AAC.2